MSKGKMRAAVVGLGRHGFRHLEAYKMLEGVEVAAVCDMDAAKVREALDQNQSARGYKDWQELFKNERLDILSVVTNGPTHAAVTIAAANAGVARILCEKPMATSVRDAREMIDVCRARGTRLAVSHARRWVKGYQHLRELIAGGLIGKPSHFWFTCGGGLFAGNGTHFMDLARFLSGSNAAMVVGAVDKSGKPNPRGAQFEDPGAVALYFFENGSRLVIDMCEDIGVTQRFEIVGTSGRVLFDEFDGRWEVYTRLGEDGRQPSEQDWWDPIRPYPFEPIVLDMVEMVAGGLRELMGDGEITCTGEDGLASLEMVIGAHMSSRQGSAPIKLPLAEEYQPIDIPFT